MTSDQTRVIDNKNSSTAVMHNNHGYIQTRQYHSKDKNEKRAKIKQNFKIVASLTEIVEYVTAIFFVRLFFF